MARHYFLIFTVILASLFLDVQATPEEQALSLPSPKSLVEDAIKEGEKILNGTFNILKGAVDKAKALVDKIKAFIRGIEDKLIDGLPAPLKKIIQTIRDTIRKVEEFGGNFTHCVTGQGEKALDIVKTAGRGMVECATTQIKETLLVLGDMQTLINEGEDLIRDAPGQLWSCVHISLSPQKAIEAITCINNKIKVFNARALLIISSMAGDLGSLGQQGLAMPLEIAKCDIYYVSGATAQVGNIVQNIGGCFQKLIGSQLG